MQSKDLIVDKKGVSNPPSEDDDEDSVKIPILSSSKGVATPKNDKITP